MNIQSIVNKENSLQLLRDGTWLVSCDNTRRDLAYSYETISKVLIDKYSYCDSVNTSAKLFILCFCLKLNSTMIQNDLQTLTLRKRKAPLYSKDL